MIADRLEAFFRDAAPAGVVAAYLYGSHAAGRAHRDSDVDVGVLLDRVRYPQKAQRGELRVTIGSALISALGCNRVDVVVLNDVSPLLAREVVRGQRVFCADGLAERTFIRDVQLRAADLAPFIEKHRQRLLEWVKR